ncbi:MAG: PAS domain S-box protein [Saprospiraceae bacterium]
MNPTQEIEALKRRIEREIHARKEAEKILEEKSSALYQANVQLKELNENLEEKIQQRTLELEESERKFRSIINEAPDIIYKFNTEGIIQFANPVLLKKLDLNEEDVVGASLLDFIPEDWQEVTWAFYQQMISLNESETYFEFPLIGKKGNWIWVGQNAMLIHRDGKVDRISGVARDITEKKEAEKTIKTTQLRFTTLISNMQSGILVEDENRNIVLTNQKFCDFFNIPISPSWLTGRSCADSAEQSKHLFKNPEEFVSRIDQILQLKELVNKEELEMVDGKILLRDYVPIFADGTYLGHLWQYQDVTFERQAQSMIAASEEKYRGIIENMELGLMEVRNDETIIRAYKRFCEMTGYTEEELIGKNALEVFLPDEYLETIKKQSNERQQGVAGVYEMQIKHKSGDLIWVLISGAPIYDSTGKVIGSIGIHYNITEQKKLQIDLENARKEAEAAKEAEKQFLANMSHEIRTPLNAIIGMSHLLADTNPTQEQESYLDILKNSGDLLQTLISDILDFSKIQSGKLELNKRPLDLEKMLQNLIKTFNLKKGKKEIEVVLNWEDRPCCFLEGDELILNQIFMNLLGNAEKFTEKGSFGIQVEKLKEEDDFVSYEFGVFDTGLGIPENKYEDIFTNFRQVNADTKRKYGGTGLGLPIVKHLLELLNSKIEVKSKVGEGTEFIFQLTFPKTKTAIVPEKVSDGISNVYSLSDVHLLVVEDNPMNQTYISTLLKKWYASFDMASNGVEGFELAKSRKYDLILMDMQMPEMDGYETTSAIREKDNLNTNTPIIALTASAFVTQKELAFESGMNDFLSKPFKPDQLLSKIQKWLNLGSQDRNSNLPAEKLFHKNLDLNLLNELYEGDSEYALTMFEIFLNDQVKDFEQFRPLAEQQKLEDLSKLAHRLKSSASMVGMSELHSILEKLESEIRNNASKQSIDLTIQSALNNLQENLPHLQTTIENLKQMP